MDVVFWAALGFLVVALVAGTAHVAARAWRTWQAFVSLAVVATAGADLLDTRSAQIAARSERNAARLEELLGALARLDRSRRRGRVLLGAIDEALDVLRAAVLFLPQR